jgi:hypothetical protein
MEETVGDFSSCVVDERCELVCELEIHKYKRTSERRTELFHRKSSTSLKGRVTGG